MGEAVEMNYEFLIYCLILGGIIYLLWIFPFKIISALFRALWLDLSILDASYRKYGLEKEVYEKFKEKFLAKIENMSNEKLELQRKKSWWAYRSIFSSVIIYSTIVLVLLVWPMFLLDVYDKKYDFFVFIIYVVVWYTLTILPFKICYLESVGFKRVADDILDEKLKK